jgi:hypothetical protein
MNSPGLLGHFAVLDYVTFRHFAHLTIIQAFSERSKESACGLFKEAGATLIHDLAFFAVSSKIVSEN